MLSVIDTLKEALGLGGRYWKFLFTLSVVTAIPLVAQDFSLEMFSGAHQVSRDLFSLVVEVGVIVVSAMKTAAILGVIKNSYKETGLWSIVSVSIKTYTWTLIRLSILLALIAGLVTVPLGFIMAAGGLSTMAKGSYVPQIILAFIAILYLIFVKYALADPLIVVEGMRARGALMRSWEMTKGRFAYVLGCYVFLGVADYFANYLSGYFTIGGTFHLMNIVNDLVMSLFECIWILMAWCMYWRIKNLETKPAQA